MIGSPAMQNWWLLIVGELLELLVDRSAGAQVVVPPPAPLSYPPLRHLRRLLQDWASRNVRMPADARAEDDIPVALVIRSSMYWNFNLIAFLIGVNFFSI